MSIYHDFQLAVAELYSRMGYNVERNRTVRGKSGAEHNIDIYARKKGLLRNGAVLVDCTYRGKGAPIGPRKVANFLLTLDDTDSRSGHLVTNTYFSEKAQTISDHYNVELLNGSELQRIFRKYRMRGYQKFFGYNGNADSPLKMFLSFLAGAGIFDSLIGRKQPDYNRANNGSRDSKEREIDFAKFISIEKPDVNFDRDVGGLEAIKEALEVAVIYPNLRRDLYLLYDTPRRNMLLYGPPGCGKTLLAKAVATRLEGEFISPRIGDLVKSLPGESERFISALFDYASTYCTNPVLFFDELDSYMPRSGPAYVKRIKSSFLEQMHGFASKKSSLSIIGATNRPWLVDIAIRRPGRFDKTIFVPPPSRDERKQILTIHLTNLRLFGMVNDDVEELTDDLAARTELWSGADLEALVNDAKEIPLIEAIKNSNRRRLRREDFHKALSRRGPSTESWFKEAVNACRRYNEDALLEEIMQYKEHYGI